MKKAAKRSKPAAKPKPTAKPADKVRCAECGYEGHILVKHIADSHKLSPLAYAEKYPDEPLFSALGAKILKEQLSGQVLSVRETESATVEDLFGWSGEVYEVRRFKDTAEFVPEGSDEGYIYPYDATLALLFALNRPKRSSIWISGPSGTGKTQLVLNVARLLNREVFRFNGHLNATPNDPIGDWVFDGKQQTFVYGPLPKAMQRGGIFLLDEVDLLNPVVMPIFRTVLEEPPTLRIPETGEVIRAAEGFAFVATANTWGIGDQTGLYGQTGNFSLADRQRFSLFVEMGYLDKDVETALLVKNVEGLDEPIAAQMVQVANSIRVNFKEGTIEEPISPRQLINWAEIFNETGDATTAAMMAFLLPLGDSTRLAVSQLIAEAGLGKGKP